MADVIKLAIKGVKEIFKLAKKAKGNEGAVMNMATTITAYVDTLQKADPTAVNPAAGAALQRQLDDTKHFVKNHADKKWLAQMQDLLPPSDFKAQCETDSGVLPLAHRSFNLLV